MGAPAESLAALRRAWEAVVRPSLRRALGALLFAAVFGAAHLARRGTLLARGGAAALVAGAFIAVVVAVVLARIGRRDVRALVRRTVSAVDPPLGEATLRAVTLVERAAVDPNVGSIELAEVHLRRLVSRVSRADLLERAGAIAVRWSLFGVVLALGALAAVAIEPFRIVEGADVLVARAGQAPLSLPWLDEVEMSAAPPEYLHESGGAFLSFSPTSVPRGTVLTVRGRPLRSGRALVLTDGEIDVPFVDDGSGATRARWTVQSSQSLHVAARFGQVRILQADEQRITSIPDEVPKVIVEGAPRTVKLVDEPNIAVHYEASDDHGLREVDLVLRSAGGKEERRVLSRPAADAKTDRGGYELRATDPFLKKSYAPVSVTVEARDNDVVSGPKWGASEVILVVPPEVGEPEALRYAGLLEARTALVGLLADRLEMKPLAGGNAVEHDKDEKAAEDKALRVVERVLGQSFGGLVLRGRFVMVARGQLRRLRKARVAESKSPSPAAHDKLVAETESALLAIDAGLRVLGAQDARSVAKRLADVAEDIATTAATSEGGDKGATKTHIDASVSVLEGGGRQMSKLGDLGRDLGEIIGNDLRRVARARTASDMFHTELAARDLAARLRRPDPSFMGGGGHGGGGGGTESGSGSGAPGGEQGDEASDAAREAEAAMRDLEEITRDHQEATDGLEQRLDHAAQGEDTKQLRDEAKEHAEAVREAAKDLPKSGNEPGGAEAAAAQGREQAEEMAGALERGDASRAVEHGKRAVQSLGEAKRLGEQSSGFFPEQGAGRKAGAAREKLDRELAWAEDALEKLRRAASENAKGDLAEHAKGEKKLAERAKGLKKKGEDGEASMPEDMLDHLQEAEQKMREAEKAMREGDGQRGLDRQKEAQRLLEMAQKDRPEEGDATPREPDSDKTGGKAPRGKAKIPTKDKHKGPDDFRRRVMEGLGGSADPLLRDAVKRYAEGLLK